ncbi:MAG TPA: molybdate ABC transporter substrate-binding protein [Chryseosolibacter sp.]|nr:molybdate ABC transporter substrate-binding protein [Chryseosolibacter sp.]
MMRIFTLVGLLVVSATVAWPQQKILVAAASDLRFALDSLTSAFESSNDAKVEISYGSSGKLAQQIVHGAPFDVFFSADIAYPEQLETEHKTGSAIYPYARGRIVLWSRQLDPNVRQIQTVVDPSVVKIAIANPMHAPYGKRAIEALQYYRLWKTVKARAVYGENISQTAQFVTSGAADAGFIALSLALSPPMQKEGGKYYLIPEESHAPLIQAAVITQHGKANALARAFLDFVKSDRANHILSHFGFTKP